MNVRQAAPQRVKVAGRNAALRYGLLTAGLRMSPDFLVVGAQRSGTTSLFRALVSHPRVNSAVMHKGVNYFDLNYSKGFRWYQAHFPLTTVARRRGQKVHSPPLAFEASGYYMFHPAAPDRIAADLPAVKIVAMLRDPVERAYSAHKHELARGFESETFETALDLEESRLEGEAEKLLADPDYYSVSHRHHAYVKRGQYAEQLSRFLAADPPSRLHVIESERFFAHPHEEYSRLLSFLELPLILPPRFDAHNMRPGSPMASTTRDRLRQHFRPHNEALADLLGHRVSWDS